MHRGKQLSHSVYVDDFKMAGTKKNHAQMLKKLNDKLELEPPKPMDGKVYLDCAQKDFIPIVSQVGDASHILHELRGPAGKGRPSASISETIIDSVVAEGMNTTLPPLINMT